MSEIQDEASDLVLKIYNDGYERGYRDGYEAHRAEVRPVRMHRPTSTGKLREDEQ